MRNNSQPPIAYAQDSRLNQDQELAAMPDDQWLNFMLSALCASQKGPPLAEAICQLVDDDQDALLRQDLMLYGRAITKGGQRIDPRAVVLGKEDSNG